jgi:S-DNA-T family DNA segregation ATPase FtsK/SpoIIIE
MLMNAAAKSSSVRLYVAVTGFVATILVLLAAILKLLGVLVTSLTTLIQRAVARPAKTAQASQPTATVVPIRPTADVPTATAPAVARPDRTLRMVPVAPFGPAETPAPVSHVRPASLALVPPPRLVVQRPFVLPAIDYLVHAKVCTAATDHVALQAQKAAIVEKLSHYGVQGTVEDVVQGPTVTTYEVSPAAGTKVSKVAGLADDLAMALGAKVRIVAPIPGKNRIGIELPNARRAPVALRELVEDPRFQSFEGALPVVLGRDTQGNPVYADLAAMPHVIVAGATGSGKSVGLNVMLTSLLYRRTPAEVRMLMIDPKVVELAPFNGIPHMLQPVVTDMKEAAAALKWAVSEMERRYQLFAQAGTRNVASYNALMDRSSPADKLPWIVIVVDEFADLMMQHAKEVEPAVLRLAQKARACGMHVILATQRPSVDVITGDIKANFPTRIAFRVSQKVDSRIILDEQGAEFLLGNGDMLVRLNGSGETQRVQCPWVSEEEVGRVTGFLRSQAAPQRALRVVA